MAFSLYRQTESTTSLKIDADTLSPAYVGRHFKLTPCNDKYGHVVLEGITEETPSIKYSTTWEDGPTTNFIKKINDLTDNNFVKTFAQKNKDYQPIIATDSWTQKYPKTGAILEVPLKIRSYYDGSYNTLNYFDFLNALFKYTAPRKFEFSQSIDQVKLAIESAKDIGINVGDVIKGINQSIQNLNKNGGLDEISWSGIANELQSLAINTTNTNNISSIGDTLNTIRKKYEEYKNKNQDIYNITVGFSSLVTILNTITVADNPGCQTFKFEYGNMYKSEYSEWVISGWSFVPSINTTYENQPLYVDITLTIRTAGKIGTSDMQSILYAIS